MGPNEASFPCRVGRVVLSYFEDRSKLDLRVVLSRLGLDFEGFLEVESGHKSYIKKHVFSLMILQDFLV